MWEVRTIVGGLFEEKRRCKTILENRKQKRNMMPGDVECSLENCRYEFKMRSMIFSYLQAGVEMGCYNQGCKPQF